MAVALNNLAAVQQARGRPKQAEALYRRALASEIACLGADHPKTAFCANNLASLLKTRGRAKEAADLFRQALHVFTTTLGPDHPNVAICLENYADTLRKLRRWREARACAKRAARILGKVEAVNDDAVALTGTINPALARFGLAVRRRASIALGFSRTSRFRPGVRSLSIPGSASAAAKENAAGIRRGATCFSWILYCGLMAPLAEAERSSSTTRVTRT